MRDDPPELSRSVVPFPGELMIWLSASFPVGGFAYSQGLETAVDRQWVSERQTLRTWLGAIVRYGSLKNDLVLISLMLRAPDDATVHDLAELSAALQPSAERAREALVQGRSFADAYQAAWSRRVDDFAAFERVTLPAALAVAARAYQLEVHPTLEAYAIAFCSNLLSVAIRLGVVGQFDSQRVMADLLPDIRAVCQIAGSASPDDLGSATYGADLASMLHETQTTRLFRS